MQKKKKKVVHSFEQNLAETWDIGQRSCSNLGKIQIIYYEFKNLFSEVWWKLLDTGFKGGLPFFLFL